MALSYAVMIYYDSQFAYIRIVWRILCFVFNEPKLLFIFIGGCQNTLDFDSFNDSKVWSGPCNAYIQCLHEFIEFRHMERKKRVNELRVKSLPLKLHIFMAPIVDIKTLSTPTETEWVSQKLKLIFMLTSYWSSQKKKCPAIIFRKLKRAVSLKAWNMVGHIELKFK